MSPSKAQHPWDGIGKERKQVGVKLWLATMRESAEVVNGDAFDGGGGGMDETTLRELGLTESLGNYSLGSAVVSILTIESKHSYLFHCIIRIAEKQS